MQKLGNFGLHLIDYPSGRYGWVGSVPAVLCDANQNSYAYQDVPAALADAEAKGVGQYVCDLDGCACRKLFPSRAAA